MTHAKKNGSSHKAPNSRRLPTWLMLVLAAVWLPLSITLPSGGEPPSQARAPTKAEAGRLWKVVPIENQPGIGPAIHSVSTNAGEYPLGHVPQYEKFEITFQVDTSVQNLQLPYDPAPPPGIATGIGISVDAKFTPDYWVTIYTQPAFYYQAFEDQIKNGKEWFYPTNDFAWKVRFAPPEPGEWQFKLVAQDASGSQITAPQSFIVVPSENHGFLRVSSKDARYFEYEDGEYFPGLGYNMTYNHVSWSNPVLGNQENFQIMSENGIQLVRIWLSQWSIFDSVWNPWNSPDPNQHGQSVPYTGLTFEQAYGNSEISMQVDSLENPCMFIGAFKAPPAVKRNTNYHVRIRYRTSGISGPRIPSKPYGFVAKTGGWLWGGSNYCYESDTGTLVTPHQTEDTSDWDILEGSFTTGSYDFLPNFYLVMENTSAGRAYIDYVWIKEDLGDGTFGANIVSKPWMAHHYYMEQRNSYAFDKALALAEAYDIYLRPVLLERLSWIFNRIDWWGEPVPDDPACFDADPYNDPERCPGEVWVYGAWRDMTKVRWLHRAWWRYVQARWGHSTHIHSWEMMTEGSPYPQVFTLADEFAIYMQQFEPNQHLVSTSFWGGFLKNEFWANPDYPNMDFADFHQFIHSNEPEFYDTAQAHYLASTSYGAKQLGGAGKPIIRGELGFIGTGDAPKTNPFENDLDGIWLHNLIWSGVNHGGMYESYWYENMHIYHRTSAGYTFDHRWQFKIFYNFIHNLELNNGDYQDATAQVSNPNLRVWGQKDLHNSLAHLWVQNRNHTWKNVVDGVTITPESGTITITGFEPGRGFKGQWWDPYQTDVSLAVIHEQRLATQGDGALVITVDDLATDIALKITSDPEYFFPSIYINFNSE